MQQQINFFATTPKGLELLLVDEIRSLGIDSVAEKLAGVTFTATLEQAYKVCLWSRLANRVLMPLASFPSTTPDELYQGVRSINWQDHLKTNGTFAVNFISSNSEINHTLFGAQKVKDAIVDQFREKTGDRPNIDKMRPDVQVYVYLNRNIAVVNLDLSGESLHKRGYRIGSGAAPLKENLAAAILIRAGWPALAKQGAGLMDPMCGTGTLLIEAALMAGDVAPGLLRQYFGFSGWRQHKPAVWAALIKEAAARRDAATSAIPAITGYDHHPAAIKSAFMNIEAAGMTGNIHVEKRELAVFTPRHTSEVGLVVVNPPYGERLGEEKELAGLYEALGERLKSDFEGWHAAVFTGNPALGKQMGLRAKKQYALFNGAIPCKLLLFDVVKEKMIDRSPEAENARRVKMASKVVALQRSPGLEAFINRLRKNIKHRHKQAKRENKIMYRAYDADLPDYAFIIDVSDDRVEVESYPVRSKEQQRVAAERRDEVLAALLELLDLPPEKIFFKQGE